MTKEIWTIGRLLKWTEEFFGGKGIETPRLDAEVLLSHVLKKERIYLYVHFDEPLQAEELSRYREAVKRRSQRIPVAQILGCREFMGLKFKVTADTLTPRPETEILVEAALMGLKEWAKGGQEPVLADLGTGTGAISLAILARMPEARAVAADISEAALRVAEENATRLGLLDRVEFCRGDFLNPLAGRKFAAIVSNPPYIPAGDIKDLPPEVAEHEPHLALDGGEDGLFFYRRLFDEGPKCLLPGGFIACEVGMGQAAKVAAMSGGYTEIVKDYAGTERVIISWEAAV